MSLEFVKNLGPIDRIVRALVGFFVISLVIGKNVPFWLFAVVIIFALSILLEALTGY